MSTRNTKRNIAIAKTNDIITRNKSAQQTRQLRAKNKKNAKPIVTKTRKVEQKSTKTVNDTCRQDTPLKNKMRQLVELVEQVEYYPDKLKRELCIKKILLKPKHNFKVIASTNKRKLAVPQKGGLKSPPPLKRHRRNSSKSTKKSDNNKNYSELSMVDMVKLIDEHHNLSDEDFMEILTCPSPVWWEDPPDDGYIEEAICTRQPDPPTAPQKNNTEDSRTNKPTQDLKNTLTDFENEIKEFKITSTKKQIGEKFVKKRQKLENILGNIKNVKNNDKNEIKSDANTKIQNNEVNTNVNNKKVRRISNSTDGEDLSDLSFNEEEILKHLENIDIPIEQIDEQNKHTDNKVGIVDKKLATVKNEVKIPDKLPPLTRKPELKSKIKTECSDSNEFIIDNVCSSNFRFISDDDITFDESSKSDSNKKMKIVNISSSLGESSSVIDLETIDTKEHEIKKEFENSNSDKNNDLPKKIVNDLSEYITVYKIMSHDTEKNEIKTETKTDTSNNNNNLDNVRGKLNSFFKKCKSNKRLKKSDPFPATSMTDVKDLKMEKENSDEKNEIENEKNRLKPCDYCVVKSGSGTKKFSCEKCEMAPIFACNLCNFLADTKETYKKHVSSCKDVERARITWNHSYLMNQT